MNRVNAYNLVEESIVIHTDLKKSEITSEMLLGEKWEEILRGIIGLPSFLDLGLTQQDGLRITVDQAVDVVEKLR